MVLKDYLWMHTGKKLFTGAKAFRSKMSLQVHFKRHSAFFQSNVLRFHDKKLMQNCATQLLPLYKVVLFFCGRQKYVKIHTWENPFVCDHCAKSLTESSSLKTHMRIHTGENLYVCEQCPELIISSSASRFIWVFTLEIRGPVGPVINHIHANSVQNFLLMRKIYCCIWKIHTGGILKLLQMHKSFSRL